MLKRTGIEREQQTLRGEYPRAHQAPSRADKDNEHKSSSQGYCPGPHGHPKLQRSSHKRPLMK